MDEKILNIVKGARSNSKKRKFSQSFDLIVNLKLLNPKKPENRISEIVVLPKGRGKDAKIIIFSDTIKGDDYKVYKSSELGKLVSDKRQLKKITGTADFFLADPALMVEIGKNLGKVLAPKGKMPTPIAGDPQTMINRYKKSIRLRVKESPVIQCLVGTESMKDEEVAENVEFVLKFLERKLPKGRNNIGNVMIKLSMGKPVKLEA